MFGTMTYGTKPDRDILAFFKPNGFICGDFYWMDHVSMNHLSQYIGADIVKAIIRANNKKFKNQKRKFICRDLTKDKLPKADIVLCRDCLNHLSYMDSQRILDNFRRSGIKYLLVTTFTSLKENTALNDQFWRPLNLQLPPFNFPEPISLIVEGCTEDEGIYKDKSLGLWRL